MSRTIEEIKRQMTDAFMQDSAAQTAYGFAEGETFYSHFSRASIESILFYVFAVCAYVIERLTETHFRQVSDLVRQLRPHTLAWYRQKALDYRTGQSLPDGSDVYSDEGLTEDEIAARKPVHQAAATESSDDAGIVIKIATTDSDGLLAPLSRLTVQNFTDYIDRVKDAGVKITVISRAGDLLRLHLVVYYDPAILDSTGLHVEDNYRPVEKAVHDYMRLLPFNGELVLEHLTDHLQTVEGVEVPHIVSAESAAMGELAYEDFADIDVRVIPASGYFRVSFDSSDSFCSTIEYRTR